MKLLTKLCALSAATLACTLFAFAQTTPPAPAEGLVVRSQPGVQISSSTMNVSDNIVSGSFTATVYSGNFDTVYYGLVLRNRNSGELVDVSPILGQLSLLENISQSANISYTLPTIYASSTDVYVNFSNKSGSSLATIALGRVSSFGQSDLCKVTATNAMCIPNADSELAISIYDRGPQGELVGTTSVSLSAKQAVTITFADLLKNFRGGHYIIATTLSSSGGIADSFATDYWKPGPVARIIGTTLVHNADTLWDVSAYTDISGYEASSTFAVSFAPTCGTPVQAPANVEGIENAQLTLTCPSGYVTISLLKDGDEIEKVYQSFSLPLPPAKDMTTQILVGLASLIAIALGIIFYIVHKHHNALLAESTIVPGVEVMPQAPPVAAAPVQEPSPQAETPSTPPQAPAAA